MRLPGRRSWAVRGALGVALGVALVLAVLRLRAEGHAARGVAEAAGGISVPWALAAGACECVAYAVPPLILAVLLGGTTVRAPAASRIALAAIGVGNLVPGQPAPETAIIYRELRARGVPRGVALSTPLVMVVAVPAVTMALLAGPTLVGAAAGAPLPAGWRVPAATAGVLSLLLGAVLVAAARSARVRGRLPAALRADAALEGMGGARGAALLIGLAVAGFTADALCLILSGRALGTHLPIGALPVAYVVATVVVAVPVLPGGLGAVEVAVPLVFRAAGVPYAEAVLAVLAWRVLQFWLPTLAGLGCYGQMMLEARRRTRARTAPG